MLDLQLAGVGSDIRANGIQSAFSIALKKSGNWWFENEPCSKSTATQSYPAFANISDIEELGNLLPSP